MGFLYIKIIKTFANSLKLILKRDTGLQIFIKGTLLLKSIKEVFSVKDPYWKIVSAENFKELFYERPSLPDE